jgi:beta-glucanase (GH16 family)
LKLLKKFKLDRSFIICLFFLIIDIIQLSGQGTTYFTGGDICKHGEWQMVFNDEFDGTQIDLSKWFLYYPYTSDGSDQCEFCRVHSDNSNQIFLDSNVQISNGTLKLIAKRQHATWYNAVREYTSGMIYSKNVFMYGRFECRCKIPYGMGFWPAFWMFGGTGTEIDVLEFGGQSPNHHHIGIAKWDKQIKIAHEDYSYDGINYSLDFHIFTVEWEPFVIKFYVDNQLKYQINRFYTISGAKVDWCCVSPDLYIINPAFPSGSSNFINITAGLGVGHNDSPFTDAPNSNTILPNQFEIDYIRAYKRNPIFDSINQCTISAYPTPTISTLTIDLKEIDPLIVEKCELIYEDGKLIQTLFPTESIIEINMAGMISGEYLVLIITKNNPWPIVARTIILHN